MTDKELLQQWLDMCVLAKIQGSRAANTALLEEIISDIKTRLAQPEPVDTNDIKEERVAKTEEQRHEPDPVAWRQWIWKTNLGLVPEENDIPLYTAPQKKEWVGLTDEEILEEYRQSYGDDGNLTDVYFARAIETKLKEKNT